MNTSSCFIIICLLLSITGCTTQPKYDIVYTNESVVKWKTLKLKECEEQSVLITLTTYGHRISKGESMTEQDVVELQKWLMDSCVRFYRLDV